MVLEDKIEEIIEAHLDVPNYGYFKTRLDEYGLKGLKEMVKEISDLFDKESNEIIDSL